MADNPKNIPQDYWKQKLAPEQYRITQKKSTEMAFTGKYVDIHTDGTYRCIASGQILFSPNTKFDSGSGSPSFTDPVNREHVNRHDDMSHGTTRNEVNCDKCDAHLGHVFPDVPADKGGQRYGINSASLDLEAKK